MKAEGVGQKKCRSENLSPAWSDGSKTGRRESRMKFWYIMDECIRMGRFSGLWHRLREIIGAIMLESGLQIVQKSLTRGEFPRCSWLFLLNPRLGGCVV